MRNTRGRSPRIRSRKLIPACAALLVFFLSYPSAGTEAESSSSGQTLAPSSSNSLQYGQVIFRYNEKGPKQVFIIGMSHRDTLTRGNAGQTSRVQAEVYKIGEWLIRNEGIQLLLPEGFFNTKSTGPAQAKEMTKAGLENQYFCPAPADINMLQERLANDRIFVNAEMLLKESHPLTLRLRQVEDWGLYDSVCKSLVRVTNSGKDSCDTSLVQELDYLQQRRLAAMLQKIPEVIDQEFQRREVKEPKAIFTIGMMHVHTIIRYLTDTQIMIRPPAAGSVKGKEYLAQLNLSRDSFGVSIILPKTLTDNLTLLQTHHLDKVVAQARSSRWN
jgi:hypothetical protein